MNLYPCNPNLQEMLATYVAASPGGFGGRQRVEREQQQFGRLEPRRLQSCLTVCGGGS